MIRSILLMIALLSGGGALLLLMQGPVTSSPETSAAPVAVEVPAAVEEPEVAEVEEPVAPETTEVLSVTGDIARGDMLWAEDFAWIDWPVDFVISGFILREDEPDAIRDLMGQFAAIDLSADDPVLATAFQTRRIVRDTGALNDAVRQIGPGMRPVSVPVELVRPLGSIILPDDRVDVVHIYFPDDSDVPLSRILVSDARVLSIEPAEDGPATNAAASTDEAVHNVVLALSFGDAADVLGAAQVGSLSLLLRDPDDAEESTRQQPSPDLAGDIASGRRAFVLSGEGLLSSGQVRAGDRVDIIFTAGPDDELWPSSHSLVSNARVIGRGVSAASADGTDGITLELDPPGVEAVTSALERGHVSISLRPENDPDARYEVHQLPTAAMQVRVRRAGQL
jgi:pilus assembly protein CpaB